MNLTEQKTTVTEIIRGRHKFLLPTNIVSLLLLFFLNFSASAQNQLLKARVDDVTDDYFGTKIVDPYRWMEDLKADETQKWMRAQAVYADDYLQKLPSRAGFLNRLEELSAGRSAVGQVKRFGNRFYYFRRAAGESVGRIMMRDAAGGAETVLLNLEKLSATDGENYSVRETASGKPVLLRIN